MCTALLLIYILTGVHSLLSLHVIVIGDYLRGEPQDYDLDSYDHRFLKLNAAQKRQINRDRRRKRQGQTRTNAQDRRERQRKHKQALSDPNRKDPNEPGTGDSQFMKKREKQRERDCLRNGGWACGWHALDQATLGYGDSDGAWDVDKTHNKHYHNNPPVEDTWYE